MNSTGRPFDYEIFRQSISHFALTDRSFRSITSHNAFIYERARQAHKVDVDARNARAGFGSIIGNFLRNVGRFISDIPRKLVNAVKAIFDLALGLLNGILGSLFGSGFGRILVVVVLAVVAVVVLRFLSMIRAARTVAVGVATT
jgi:hypothetical protein